MREAAPAQERFSQLRAEVETFLGEAQCRTVFAHTLCYRYMGVVRKVVIFTYEGRTFFLSAALRERVATEVVRHIVVLANVLCKGALLKGRCDE